MDANPKKTFRSTGAIVADFQISHRDLARVISRCGVEAKLILNGVRYFDDDAIKQIYAAARRMNLGAGMIGNEVNL